MPLAVTHFLIPVIIVAIFRDIYKSKTKKKFPLHYVLITGLAGLLPDLDFLAFAILNFFGFSLNQVHRIFSHSIFFPPIFLILCFIFLTVKNKELGKHKMTFHGIFFIIFLGTLSHIILDALLSGTVYIFYPISQTEFGLNLINLLPNPFNSLFLPILDAALLILWMIYIEWKHKLSDFI